jgi:uroporphyrinogen decarboxylase
MQRDRFLKACRREPTDCTPVWMMRQAGRYLPEYRAVRNKYSFLEMCKNPELAAEVTLQPARLGVDALILFADILLPLEGMGLKLEFSHQEGPIIHNPVRRKEDVSALRIVEPEESVPYVFQAIALVRRELDGRLPLIGFAGAPFTLASYMIEGRGSRNYLCCKEMMWKAPEIWHPLMEKVSQMILSYLKGQIAAGAQAVQMFDSWVGTLAPEDYRDYVLPYSRYVLEGLKEEGVPVIHFANNASSFLELIGEGGGDVIGLDWRIGLDEAWRRLGYGKAIQGNLDPAVLLAPPPVIEQKVQEILKKVGGRPGHIFNLGHGIHKETPVENAQFFIEAVHRLSRV